MTIAKYVKFSRRRRAGTPAPALGAKTRSWKILSVPAIMASTFGKLNLKRRAHLLGRLLGSVGPLALAVVADGVFFKYLGQAGLPQVPVSFDDAALASSKHVYDLVRYVEQSNPRLVQDLLTALLKDGMTMTAIGASIAAITIMHFSDRSGLMARSSTRT